MGMKTLPLQSERKIEFIDITAAAEEFVRTSGCEQGVLLVFSPHTTAGITINENADPAVGCDLREFFLRRVPSEKYFRHLEGNSPAHIMSSLVTSSTTLIVENGRLLLGRWQGIFFCEFDGPRRRQVHLKLIAG